MKRLTFMDGKPFEVYDCFVFNGYRGCPHCIIVDDGHRALGKGCSHPEQTVSGVLPRVRSRFPLSCPLLPIGESIPLTPAITSAPKVKARTPVGSSDDLRNLGIQAGKRKAISKKKARRLEVHGKNQEAHFLEKTRIRLGISLAESILLKEHLQKLRKQGKTEFVKITGGKELRQVHLDPYGLLRFVYDRGSGKIVTVFNPKDEPE